MNDRPRPATASPAEPSPPPRVPPTIDVGVLLAGGQEVRLRHRNQEYRLRLTRSGKLILTK